MPLSGVAVAIGRNSFDPPAPVVPVYDIHTRLLVFHDSGTPAHSGILSYHSQRGVLNFQPSNSGAQAVVTAVYFDAYIVSSGTILSTSPLNIFVDTVRQNSHPEIFAFVAASGELQINMSGVYCLEYRGSADNDSSAIRSSAMWWFERQAPGGLWAEIPGSRAFSYHRINNNGSDTANCKIIQDAVGVGDKFRFRGQILSGVARLAVLPSGCSLTVRKLG